MTNDVQDSWLLETDEVTQVLLGCDLALDCYLGFVGVLSLGGRYVERRVEALYFRSEVHRQVGLLVLLLVEDRLTEQHPNVEVFGNGGKRLHDRTYVLEEGDWWAGLALQLGLVSLHLGEAGLEGIQSVSEGGDVVFEEVLEVAGVAADDDHDVAALFLDVVDVEGPAGLNEFDFVVGLAVEHDGLVAGWEGGYVTL